MGYSNVLRILKMKGAQDIKFVAGARSQLQPGSRTSSHLVSSGLSEVFWASTVLAVNNQLGTFSGPLHGRGMIIVHQPEKKGGW